MEDEIEHELNKLGGGGYAGGAGDMFDDKLAMNGPAKRQRNATHNASMITNDLNSQSDIDRTHDPRDTPDLSNIIIANGGMGLVTPNMDDAVFND